MAESNVVPIKRASVARRLSFIEQHEDDIRESLRYLKFLDEALKAGWRPGDKEDWDIVLSTAAMGDELGDNLQKLADDIKEVYGDG